MTPGSRGIWFGSAADTNGLPAFADPESTVVVADGLTRRFLPARFSGCPLVIVPRGEEAKSLATLDSVYAAFLEAGIGRDWTILAIGGGSVTDVAGFAASTWLRGIDFGFMPTTLLGMVDASVGGKNGINFGGRKNLVGNFSKPRFIVVDLDVLSGLGDEGISNGMAEVIKHAVIDGQEHLGAVEAALRSGAHAVPAGLEGVIRLSVELKTRITEADERENGGRMRLNLGHTIGHAVEAVTGLSHGRCVSVGMVAAFGLAARMAPDGEAAARTRRDARRITELLSSLGLPVALEEARLAAPAGPMDSQAFRLAVARAVGADKKRRGDTILFAVPRGIGDVDIQAIASETVAELIREAP